MSISISPNYNENAKTDNVQGVKPLSSGLDKRLSHLQHGRKLRTYSNPQDYCEI